MSTRHHERLSFIALVFLAMEKRLSLVESPICSTDLHPDGSWDLITHRLFSFLMVKWWRSELAREGLVYHQHRCAMKTRASEVKATPCKPAATPPGVSGHFVTAYIYFFNKVVVSLTTLKCLDIEKNVDTHNAGCFGGFWWIVGKASTVACGDSVWFLVTEAHSIHRLTSVADYSLERGKYTRRTQDVCITAMKH